MARRVWLSACMHARRPGALLSACGRRLSRTLRWTRYPDQVTCQRCRDLIGLDSPEARLLRSIYGQGDDR